jgi:hypothetical protein
VPSFCRHNRLIHNCPICSREQAVELRPLVSSSTPPSTEPRRSAAPGSRRAERASGPPRRAGVKVQRLARQIDDGYRSSLAPGLKSREDATRLTQEMAFAARRLAVLESEPPGLYAEVADTRLDLEERTWLALLIAYLCPLEGDRPFAEIERLRTCWPVVPDSLGDGVATGPRSGFEPSRAAQALEAYRAWAQRAGSQHAAFRGEDTWSAERRFARVFERLALPGIDRDCRFELLVSLGRLGLYELRAGRLELGGENEVTISAKRILGIGDPILLERRAAELASACQVPLEALDLAFYNWSQPPAREGAEQRGGKRATLGLSAGAKPDPEALASARRALGV